MYGHPLAAHTQAAALCPQAESMGVALQFRAPGQVPEWIELIPAGEFQGRDGRRFVNSAPDAVVAAFADHRGSLPVDIEHSSEHKAQQGDPAPAVGWVESLEVRDGAVWARVEWTDQGRELIASRQYRYYSPVFWFEKSTDQVLALKSAGLTNQPNLHFPALNQQRGAQSPTGNHEEPVMALNAIRAALGLAEDASETSIIDAIKKLTSGGNTSSNQAQAPDPAKYVPIDTHNLAVNRAREAEAELARRQAEALEAEIEAAVNAAIAEGKVAPSSKDYYLAQCRTEGGLAAFQAFAEKAPAVLPPDSGADARPPGQSASAHGFRTPAGYEVDPQRAELHNRALEYAQQHNCTYADAAIAVGA